MRFAVLAGTLLALYAPPWEAQQVSYEGGLSASSGTYIFTERTNSFALSTGLYLKTGRFSFRATVPLWLQNTTLVTSSGAGSVPTGGPYGQDAVSDSGQAREQRQQGGSGNGQGPGGRDTGGPGGRQPAPITPAVAGEPVPAPTEAITGYQVALADPTLAVTARVLGAGRLMVSLGGTVKFPLADTATIGTGEWDVGASLSVSVLAGSRWTFGLDAAYWHLGDLDSLELQDPLLGTVSVGALLGDRWGAMLSLMGSTTTLTGFDPPVSITAGLNHVAPSFTWGLNLGAGLTESAPDIMVGLLWSVPFGRGGSP